MDNAAITQAAKIIAESKFTIALSGAGLSVDSGIPDFRSADGLWARFDPMDYAHIESFRRNPVRVWKMIHEMSDVVYGAKPNPGHLALSELEKLGKLRAIITQNIDNLHQEAGNTEVVEFHGNTTRFHCLWCENRYSGNEIKPVKGEDPPVCECGKILKPEVIFFGEAIPPEAYKRSMIYAEQADVMLVVGTSAQVAPANMLPAVTKSNGGQLIEVNIERTHLSDAYGALHIEGSTTQILPKILEGVRELIQ